MDSVFVPFLTTDKAMITKLDQNIKQVQVHIISKIRGQEGHSLGHVTYF